MTNTELISKHLELIETKQAEQAENCCLCGAKTKLYLPVKKVLSEKFTDQDRFLTNSKIVCQKCATCIKEPKLRRSCFYASEEALVYFKKEELERVVFEDIKKISMPFVFCITESYKKHNSFKARLNYDPNLFYIQFEDTEFIFPATKVIGLYAELKKAYNFFTKAELLSGDYKKAKGDITIEQIMSWEQLFNKHRGKMYFNFLIMMLKKEDNK